MEIDKVEWDSIPKDKVEYIVDHARRRVEHQISLMVAADQRATQLAAMMVAIALGMVGAAGAFLQAEAGPLATGFGVGAAIAMAGAIISIISARPIDITPSSQEAKSIVGDDVYFAASVAGMKAGEVAVLQAAHDYNARAAKTNARLTKTALLLLALSPLSVILIWVLTAWWEERQASNPIAPSAVCFEWWSTALEPNPQLLCP